MVLDCAEDSWVLLYPELVGLDDMTTMMMLASSI